MQTDTFPLYFPITARKRLFAMGIGTQRSADLPARPLNIVWLVGESLRWDALDPEVVPAAFGFSHDSCRAACIPPRRRRVCAAPRANLPEWGRREVREMRRAGAALGIAGGGRRLAAAWLLGLAGASSAAAYPGGTPMFQTDVAPYCAACHSSRSAAAFEGAGERAEQELVERKQITPILAGQKGYESLSAPDREALVQQIRALDAASTVTLRCPDGVPPGALFEVEVDVTGGGGPVVGVGLVDRDQRWWARPAASAGWQVAAEPRITGPDGEAQLEWLSRRPESAGRNLSFVNVTGIASDPARGAFAHAKVVFVLRAPERPGSYPLAAVYFYGTEKSTVLGYTTDAQGRKQVRGGFDGGSGRVLFTPVRRIEVRAADAAASGGSAPAAAEPQR